MLDVSINVKCLTKVGSYSIPIQLSKSIIRKKCTFLQHLFPVVKPPWMEGRGPQVRTAPPKYI